MTGQVSRLFFALWPDDVTRRQINQVGSDGVFGQTRRTRLQNLHLTVQFLGNVSVAIQHQLADMAGEIRVSSFSLELDLSGQWKPARVAWLAPSKIPIELMQLYGALHELALTQVAQVDNRPYRPHVTLARKVDAPVALQFAPIRWNVTDFCLVESLPHTGYVEYKIIHRWALT